MQNQRKTSEKISNEQVNRVVEKILNKRQRILREQQKTFVQRDLDEKKKRDNYLLDKFLTKEVREKPTKKKIRTIDDDDDDFVSTKKAPKLMKIERTEKAQIQRDPIADCLNEIISHIENQQAVCPICNELLSDFNVEERQRHVDLCLEKIQLDQIENKQQRSLLEFSTSNSTIRKTSKASSSVELKCKICGLVSSGKGKFLLHLKKCSNENSIQLKTAVTFAGKVEAPNEKKTIRNRVLKMEIPKTLDDEEQQIAVALSASLRPNEEIPNAFDLLRNSSRKNKISDSLLKVSAEEKQREMSKRISNLCERLIEPNSSEENFLFAQSFLFLESKQLFGLVDWWKISTTNPLDDEVPMSQLERILDETF